MSVWFVRASLVHLILGFTLGAVLLAGKGLAIGLAPGRLIPAHMEVLLIGWIVQLVMGVAFWILPRYGLRPTSTARVRLAWLAFSLLNAGVVCAALAPLAGPHLEAAAGLVGRIGEIAAAAAFALGLRGRMARPGLSEM